MLQSALTTVLISAVTAAFVTLVMEYLAKPKLEARKDRIVEEARAWRDLNIQLELLIYARVFVHRTSQLPWPQLRDGIRELVDLLGQCEQSVLRVKGYMPLGTGNLLSVYRDLLIDIQEETADLDAEPDDTTIPQVLSALRNDVWNHVFPSVWRHTRPGPFFRGLLKLFRRPDIDNYEFNDALEAVGDLIRRLD